MRRSNDPTVDARSAAVEEPARAHDLLAVFPTLTVLNLVLSGSLKELPITLRTFILATIAVPIVIYGDE